MTFCTEFGEAHFFREELKKATVEIERLRKDLERVRSLDQTENVVDILRDLQDEIDRLRRENAELALELHHYVSKEFEDLGLPE